MKKTMSQPTQPARWKLITSAFLLLGLFSAVYYTWDRYTNDEFIQQPKRYGTTFSTKYARELQLDWQEAYLAMLQDLDVNLVRVPVYWDTIETQPNQYTLEEIQWMLDQAEKHDADIILAIGNRTARWPECHPPQWTDSLTVSEFQAEELAMITHVVEEFKDHPALYRWQVHNEPFLEFFGECDPADINFIRSSIAKVRWLDPDHKIMTTDSGELSNWQNAASVADILGVSLYRVTYNRWFGYFYYPLSPSFYTNKAKTVEDKVEAVIVSELQAEPWVDKTITTTPLSEQYRSMNVQQFERNIDFASRIDTEEVLLWGVEWWYWLQQKHDQPEMWQTAQQVYRELSI